MDWAVMLLLRSESIMLGLVDTAFSAPNKCTFRSRNGLSQCMFIEVSYETVFIGCRETRIGVDGYVGYGPRR